MKSFILGFVGFFIAAIMYLFVVAQYSDYRAEAEMGSWCVSAKAVISQINDIAVQEKELTNISARIPALEFDEAFNVKTSLIQDNGIIVIQGGSKTQLMVLIPSFTGLEITWQAFMSPAKLMPLNCESLPSKSSNSGAVSSVGY